MKGRVKVWTLGLMILLIVIGVGWFLSAWLDTSHPPYSSRSSAEEGLRGIYRLLDDRGVPVDRWEAGWNRLPDSEGHVLWIAEPRGMMLTETAFESLRRWIQKGNTVVIWSKPGDILSGRLGLQAHGGHQGEQDIQMSRVSDGWRREIRTLHFVYDGRLDSDSDLDDAWMDREGIARVGMRNLGNGAIFYIPEAEPITNRGIDQGDNVALALYLASLTNGQGKLWFDETVHREGHVPPEMEEGSPGLTDLLTPMMWWFVLQLFLLLILWLYRGGKRFASPRWENVRVTRTGDEYIQAMASLYERAGLGREALNIQLNALMKETKTRLGLPLQAAEEVVYERAEQLMGTELTRRLQTLVNGVNHLPESPKGRTLIRWSREVQKLREEMEAWRTKGGSTRDGSGTSPKK
ncbi:DUF4350 domain-containing protein [Kroppenstedtia eburnea]|uniref:DUF4350 domain-containing protein n=1 Tax=Kroppenstedtia eburnea TaxID=714067 RepID=A0A1N7ISL6_9BACL|nr:DUF4350 domain-containing protein [Kroppenstedtia eburnea]QKI82157.1 DUF4350 domain-containing protein [Kroppenstedtia eburnea]SIS40074.1 protein of unknown function [Kroppenstedtia eburnea]